MASLRRVVVRLLLALAVVMPFSLAAAPAYAENSTPSSWKITDYVMDAQVSKDGDALVTLDLAFDFARDPGHGPFIVLPVRQPQPNDPDHWREMPVTVKSVSSPTGANTATKTTEENGMRLIRLGTEGRTYTGVQRYRIIYTLHGITTPDNPESHLDEISWNAVGPAWQVPIQRAQVTVRGPGNPTKIACFTGKGFTQPCQARADANAVTYTASNLPRSTGVQIVAGYPVGTLTAKAQPQLSRRYTVENMFPITPATGGVTALLAALGVGGVVARARRRGRDEEYAGLTPGLTPTAGAEATTKAASGRRRFAVQFQPPAGVTPGEVGTLIDERADSRDVTATIVDLAVRGHLRIDEDDAEGWRLTRLPAAGELAAYERSLMSRLFISSDVISLEDMKTPAYADVMPRTQTDLYRQVVSRGWFRSNPQTVRAATAAVGFVVMLAGLGVGVLLGLAAGWGIVGVAGALIGLAIIATSGMAPSRTADGSAVYAQSKGFEEYLTTAEAGQIKFEEGIDVFSRYLPYAIVFGVAERWAKIFEELQRQGVYQADTSWYGSPHSMGFFYGSNFGAAMDSMTQSMESAMQESIQASQAESMGSTSGGSGFSGGGGFGGGGGGGW